MAEQVVKNGMAISVFSTASAVGKTLVSTNLAAELARNQFDVCLLDLDLQFGDVYNYLYKQIPEPPEMTIADAQRAIQKDEASFEPLDFLTMYQYGGVKFYILPAPYELAEAYNIDTESVVRIAQAIQKRFDYVIFDMTAAFSELNLALLDLSTIVTFLGIVDFIPTIKNMKSGCETLRSIGYDEHRIRIILNRSGSQSRLGRDEVEQLLGSPFYHFLANDFRGSSASIRIGIPLVLNDADSKLKQDLQALVARYTNRNASPEAAAAKEQSGGGIFSRLFR